MKPAAPVTTIKLDSRTVSPVCCRAVKHAATEEELARYRRDGYFVRERVFGPSELARMRAGVEAVHARVSEAAAAQDAGEIERIDGKRYQELLGSLVKWEWQERAPTCARWSVPHLTRLEAPSTTRGSGSR
jgi:hypothetical protein